MSKKGGKSAVTIDAYNLSKKETTPMRVTEISKTPTQRKTKDGGYELTGNFRYIIHGVGENKDGKPLNMAKPSQKTEAEALAAKAGLTIHKREPKARKEKRARKSCEETCEERRAKAAAKKAAKPKAPKKEKEAKPKKEKTAKPKTEKAPKKKPSRKATA